MVSKELKDIIDKLDKQGKMRFLEAATEERISQFEEIHKIKLPQKYKAWLEYSDGGDLFLPSGVQFYGVSHKPIMDIDCSDRPDESFVVIGALNTGDPILFKKDDEQISIYNQEAGRIEEDEVYEDFFAFLNALYDLLGIEG